MTSRTTSDTSDTSILDSGFVDVTQAARILGIARQTVYQMVSRKELPACRLGGTIRPRQARTRRPIRSRPPTRPRRTTIRLTCNAKPAHALASP